jgi:glucokinase
VSTPSATASDFVVAIDFGATKIAVATATLDGTLAHRTRLDTDAAHGADQAVARALVAARSAIAAARDGGGRCLAAGVVSPGVVRADRILLAPNVPGWEALALARAIGDGLGIGDVVAGNDVKAAARSEARWGSLRGADPGVFLSLGTGVGVGVVVGGHVLQGRHGAAGEIGYNLLGRDGEAGVADGRAPLEELVGGRAIGARATRLLGRPVTAADAFADPDPRVRALVDETVDVLARHVAQMAILVDPQRIAVGGGLTGAAERILPALAERLERFVPMPPELVLARHPHDAALRGAAALAIDRVAGTSSTPMGPREEEDEDHAHQAPSRGDARGGAPDGRSAHGLRLGR